MVAEALLRQSSFSKMDNWCSPARQSAMLHLIMQLMDLATQAVARGVAPTAIAKLRVLEHVRRLGEEHGEEDLAGMIKVWNEVVEAGEAFPLRPSPEKLTTARQTR